MNGPAKTLHDAGIDWSDFLAWTSPEDLVADLRVLPFTAKKLLACREKFLAPVD